MIGPRPQASRSTPHGRVHRFVVAFWTCMVGVAVVGCDGDDTASVSSADVQALVAATDEVAAACVDRDHARMRDLSSPGIHDRIRDQDNVFNPAVENVTIVDRETSVEGDDATVEVTLEFTIDGSKAQVEQTWAYERVDDGWVLSSVPSCDLTDS